MELLLYGYELICWSGGMRDFVSCVLQKKIRLLCVALGYFCAFALRAEFARTALHDFLTPAKKRTYDKILLGRALRLTSLL